MQKHALRQKTQHIAVKSGKAMAAQCLKECHLPLREAPAPAMFQCAQGKACRKPQLQHDIVFPRADAVLLVGRRPGQKLRRALGAEKAPAAKAAVGVRAKAQVVLAVPVQQVVAAGKAGLCKIGYLILGIAARGQRVCAGKIKAGGPVVVRQAFGRGFAPWGAGLQLQQITRDMCTAAVLQKVQRGGQLFLRIAGKCQHHIA